MAKILITPRAFAKSGLQEIEKLKACGYEVHFNDTGKSYSYEEFCQLAEDVDGIIIGVDRADRKMLERCKHLKAISKYGVGVDNIDLDAAKEFGIRISRALGANSIAVAEHTMALLADLAKNTTKSAVRVREGNWDKIYSTELYGKTLGIVGFGNVGKQVCRIAQGFGMRVYAYDTFPIDSSYAETQKIKIVDFQTLITESDAVTLHLPLTEETRDMIDEKVLKAMKPTTYLINAARGGIVNEKDLYVALKEGEITGAAFDVLSSEPPKKGELLLTLDNFILTPHTASKTKEADANTIRISVENLLADL